MSVVSRSTLKGYFNTGDRPTENNFADLIDSSINLTDGGTVEGTFKIGNIQSAANTDADHYIINGSRGEIRSQLQGALAADTGFTIELRNTSIAANSLIIANLIGGEGGLITGSVVTANVVAANTASLNFFNTGAAVVNDAKFTASFAVL